MLKLIWFCFAISAGVVSIAHAGAPGFEPQVSNVQGVKVTATPQNLAQEAQTWEFEITLETHTQTLGDDLTKSSTLIAGGEQYAPSGWEGAPPGGHHRKGLLRFKAIVPQPPSVELRILRVGESSTRNFKWMLKGARNGN